MMYFAEILKLAISGLFFILAIGFWHVEPFSFLISYFVVQCAYWLSPWMFKESRSVI